MIGLEKFRLYNNRLNSEYKLLPYIEGTGSQLLNTGVFGTGNVKVEVDITINTSYTSGWWGVFGACRSNINMSFLLGINSLGTMTVQAGTNVFQDVSNTFVVETPYNLILDGGKAYINGVQRTNLTPSSYTTPVPIALFRQAFSASTNMNFAKMKLYKCKIWESSVLTREFYPALRLSDKIAGLYEAISGIFYTSIGINQFTY